jgi:hypothetical protein
MTDDTSRTVADLIGRANAVELGINPEWLPSDVRRRLEMGERAEQALAEHARWRLSDKEALYHIRGDR